MVTRRRRPDAATLLVNAVGQMYEAAAGFRTWSDALTTIAETTRSRYAALQGALRDGNAPLLFVYDSGLGESVLDPYGRFVAEHGDPRVDYALRHSGEVFTDFAFTDERGMERHPYYKELLEPLGLYYGAVVELAPDGVDWAAGISLHRSRRQGPFDSEALRLFSIVAQHGRKAVLMAHRLLRSGVTAAVGESLLGADGCGYVLLDGHGRVVEMNAAARRMIAESKALLIDGRELRLRVSGAQGALQRALRAGSNPCAASGTILAGKLAIDVYPLNGERWPIGLSVRTMVVLTERRCAGTLGEYDGAASALNEQQGVRALREHYGLTPSESAVALALCRGQSVAEIAEQRGTTREAVRFHLKNVFQKLHVRRQSELIRVVSTGPAAFVLRSESAVGASAPR